MKILQVSFMTLEEALSHHYGINKIIFKFDILPVPKPRMTQRDRWQKRPAVLRYREFCDLFRLKLKKHGIQSLPEVLDVVFVLPMPASWSRKKREQNLYAPHRQTPDRDNLLKALQDVQDQDKCIYDGRTLKIWGEEPAIIIF